MKSMYCATRTRPLDVWLNGVKGQITPCTIVIIIVAKPVTIKNGDKIHDKVGFLVKNRDILKFCQNFKLRD